MLAFITKTDKMDKVKSAHWIQLATRKLEEYEEKYYRCHKFPCNVKLSMTDFDILVANGERQRTHEKSDGKG